MPQEVHSLYLDHHGWLQGWLRHKLGCAHQAADLAHDVFVRLLLRREPAPMREPRAYLATVARGLLIDHWRRQGLERAWLRAPVRTAFLLAQLEGACYDDIATRLGVTRRSVERYVAEALFHCYSLRHAC